MTNVSSTKSYLGGTHSAKTNASKRSSSVGAAFKRLFSKSPSRAERSSSETSVSLLGAETPQGLGGLNSQRGRTPPKQLATPTTSDFSSPGETSTIPPNNSYFCPTNPYNEGLSKKHIIQVMMDM